MNELHPEMSCPPPRTDTSQPAPPYVRRRGGNVLYPLCADIALSAPVVQAVLGPCDTTRLAVEVSRAGGLGTYTLKNFESKYVRRRAATLRSRTTRPVLIALNQPWERDDVLDICASFKIRWFQVFWWNGPRLAGRIHARGAQVFWQVNTIRHAEEAMECGADVLVLQGTEAGGQVRGGVPLLRLIDDVRNAVGIDVPLVAGGGLADIDDVERVLAHGARAALFGTRFLLSKESRASVRWKSRLIRATSDDLTLETRMTDQWPNAPRRHLALRGVDETPELYAGLGIDRMNRVLRAAEIVRNLTPRSEFKMHPA